MVNVCIIGLGQVGYPTWNYIFPYFPQRCYGFDPHVNYPMRPWLFTDFHQIPICDVYVICVPTDKVEEAVWEVRRVAPSALICIESTVPVGTCSKLGLDIVHCPHRWWSVDPVHHGVRQPRVIGGVDESSLQQGIDFYQSIDIPLHVVRPVEAAELSKVVENAYEYLKIAFAEEVAMICSRHGVPYDQVRQACNTNTAQNVRLMEARRGVGGKCLPMAAELLDSPLLKQAMMSDEIYRKKVKP